MANTINWGKIYESTAWGNTDNSISWGKSYADLAGGYDYLLDTYSGAAAAYSLRQLSSTYSGDAIVVRRASDNTTQSIGFVNNELDTATLESFCSGTDGFVTTWYDQSGNGNDAAQATASQQPKIVSIGSTITDNGKAAVQFDGGIQRLFGTDSGALNSVRQGEFTYIGVARNQESGTPKWNVIYTPSTTNSATTGGMGALAMQIFFDQQKIGFHNTWKAATELATIDISSIWNNQLLIFQTRDNAGTNGNGSNVTNNVNNLSATGIQSWTSNIGTQFIIGSQEINESSSVDEWDGYIQEIVVYPTDQTTNKADMKTNINSYYSIY